MIRVDLKVPVEEGRVLDEPAHVALTVHLPAADDLPARPVVCFAKPGGGYSKGYFTEELPGPARGAQAEWHARRGWIFVSVDHLGVGDSSLHEAVKLDFAPVAAASHLAEAEVLRRLADGSLADGYPRVQSPLRLGIGQSMGGCMTIVQQARHRDYDGIGILGYSAIHIQSLTRPSEPAIVHTWIPRDSPLTEDAVVLNEAAAERSRVLRDDLGLGHDMGWGFHFDDIDPDVVRRDLARYRRGIHDPAAQGGHKAAPWSSLTLPGAVARKCIAPRAVAQEAAAITVPVLIAFGERDVAAVPKLEPTAYQCADSVDLFICPRMAHMHNFAGTRELFWQRIERFADWVRDTVPPPAA
jgi:pimeloyl-ACP methyl ester carboxylesterase